MGAYLVYFIIKVLAWENWNMKWGFAKKVIIKSQRQFIYGSNFYESGVTTKSSNLEKMFDVHFGSEGQI